MKIARKEFQHPAGYFEEAKDLFWWGNVPPEDKKAQWVAKSLAEVRQDVMDFVNTVTPQQLVNVCEYTTNKNACGDDGITHFVVWYWE